MNARERTLSILIGLILLLAVVYAGWSRMTKMLTDKEATITGLKKQISDDEFVLLKGKRATKQLKELSDRSMPADLDQARTLYRQWLLSVSEAVGLKEPYIKPLSGRDRGGKAYKQIKFQLECKPTLEQATNLLHRIYSSDDLHRVQMMSLKPVKGSKQFDLSMTIEGLALNNAKGRTELGNLTSKRLKHGSVEDYVSLIASRNLFAPANQAPKLEKVAKQSATVGTSLEIEITGSDPDELDKLTYELVGDGFPEGVEIKNQDGKATLHWARPKEAGEFTFQVKTTDDGIPAKSDSLTFQVVVQDPPPPPPPREKPAPKPRFDDSKHSYVIGTFEFKGTRDVWIEVRTKGEILKLVKGDRLEIGTFTGVVDNVGVNGCQIKTDDGLVAYEVGQKLTEGTPIEPGIDKEILSAQKSNVHAAK